MSGWLVLHYYAEFWELWIFPVDTEVWMLYSSNLRGRSNRPHFGLGVLWSYGSQAQAIGVGSTGGGIDFIEDHGDRSTGRSFPVTFVWPGTGRISFIFSAWKGVSSRGFCRAWRISNGIGRSFSQKVQQKEWPVGEASCNLFYGSARIGC